MAPLLNKTILLLIVFLSYSSCQRNVNAEDKPDVLSACYKITAEDGYDDLLCDGVPFKFRPGPPGPRGERGANGASGAPGPMGPPGRDGGGRSVTKVTLCYEVWPDSAGTYDIRYSILDYNDDSREVFATIVQTGSDAGIFSNSAIFFKNEALRERAPLDVQGFSIELKSAQEANIRYRPTGRQSNFPCN